LKGPADRLLAELGHDVSCVGVADYYEGLIGTFIIDQADADLRDVISARGVKVEVTTTVMADPDDALRLARVVLA
jgi:LPPG:FO 2-phospho-L-lactate transferase